MKNTAEKITRCCLRIGHAGDHMWIESAVITPLIHECPARGMTKAELKEMFARRDAELAAKTLSGVHKQGLV